MSKSIRGFYEHKRAWYAKNDPDRADEFMIGKYYVKGGCDYEFKLIRVDFRTSHNSAAWKLEIFQDSVRCITHFAGLFEFVGKLTGNESADIVCAGLVELGIRDLTKETK